jgi:D-sedoheptulose 7-phosphate isomerase
MLNRFSEINTKVNAIDIERLAIEISDLKKTGGRLFILGVGGSAANASHAVNDFRKLCGIQAYCPTDNVSELTAIVNDSKDGWKLFFANWLSENKLNSNDILLILSVGGGSLEDKISENLVVASEVAKIAGLKVLAILGRDGGEVGKIADYKVIIPNLFPTYVTPIVEGIQSVILHILVTNPILQENETTW